MLALVASAQPPVGRFASEIVDKGWFSPVGNVGLGEFLD